MTRDTSDDARIDRRTVLAATGAVAVTALAGCSGGGGGDGGDGDGGDGGSGDGGDGGGGDGGGSTDFGGWFDGVDNFDGVVDETGSDEVAVTVGAEGNDGYYAFEPAAVRVSSGTTVVWEWTGEGSTHNVVDEGGAFESELVGDAGHTFEYTFEDAGTYEYVCVPHEALGMKGAVVVE